MEFGLGILPEKSKISGAIILTREDGVPPEVSGFRRRPRPEVRDRTVLTPEAAGIKESARGAVALLLADLARREHRQPEMRPQTSPRKDKSTALRATHSPATARKGGTQGEGTGGPVKCLNRPQEGTANRPYFAYKIFGLGSHNPGGEKFSRIYRD